MTDGALGHPRRGRLALGLLGALSLLLFWLPLLAPLLQAGTLALALWRAWRGSADRLGVILAAAGAGLGFCLFLALQYVWLV